jgi:hypothetical protein
MRYLPIFFFVLFFTHAESPQAMTEGTQRTANVFESSEDSYLDPIHFRGGHLEVRGMELAGFDQTGHQKLQASFRVLEKVVNSLEFKNRVINFKNRKNERAFASNMGLTNEDIYEIFMEGRETLQPETAGEMNFFLKLYYNRFSQVIGHTSKDTNTININWKFFKDFEPHQVASNLAHEWVHKIGFDHRSASESDSVPYAIGNIVRELGEKYVKGRELH